MEENKMSNIKNNVTGSVKKHKTLFIGIACGVGGAALGVLLAKFGPKAIGYISNALATKAVVTNIATETVPEVLETAAEVVTSVA